MRKLILSFALLFICSTLVAQMPKSKKLGETDGLPTINITKSYESSMKGLTKLKENSDAWSDLKNTDYGYEFVMLGDQKKLKYENVYGLDVERIEIFSSEKDETKNYVYAIAVFLKLPETDDELSKFYQDFMKAYEEILDMVGISDAGYHLYQWRSETSCGAMMKIPAGLSLKEFKKYGLEYVEITFTQSCGG